MTSSVMDPKGSVETKTRLENDQTTAQVLCTAVKGPRLDPTQLRTGQQWPRVAKCQFKMCSATLRDSHLLTQTLS